MAQVMMRRSIFLAAAALAAVFALAPYARAQQVYSPGAACGDTVKAAFWEQSSICNTTSGQWQRPAFQFGAAISSCAAGTAGLVQWTGTSLQICDGSA
jgi:hypothetical protein